MLVKFSCLCSPWWNIFNATTYQQVTHYCAYVWLMTWFPPIPIYFHLYLFYCIHHVPLIVKYTSTYLILTPYLDIIIFSNVMKWGIGAPNMQSRFQTNPLSNLPFIIGDRHFIQANGGNQQLNAKWFRKIQLIYLWLCDKDKR